MLLTTSTESVQPLCPGISDMQTGFVLQGADFAVAVSVTVVIVELVEALVVDLNK